MERIGIAMTCFNRREKTIEALRHIFASRLPAEVQLSVFLTDAASPDNTAGAVQSEFPSIRVIHGASTLYWNAGMRLSLAAAYADEVDFVLWLNDDSLLTPTAVAELLASNARCSSRLGSRVITIGTTRDIATNQPTYGGVVFPVWWRPTTQKLVQDDTRDIECESLNGNIVLIPREVYRRLGNLDENFTHGLGDFDYGFRARDAGFHLIAAPGFHGYCSRNSERGTFRDTSLSFRQRWSLVCAPKGRPPRPWAIFTRRHLGPMWFLYWAWPYFYTVVSSLIMHGKRDTQ